MSGGGSDDLHLPQEICSDILTKVPIKSILRFRSVCKSWNSLISCPDFKPKTLSYRFLLKRTDRKSYVWSLSSHNMSFSESLDHCDDIPDRFRGQELDPIGSCDGLICFYNHRVDRSEEEIISSFSFFIYNPCIRKFVELPSFTFDFDTLLSYYCGFGFDSKASDYKVMVIMKVALNVDSSDEDETEQLVHETSYYGGFMFDLRNGVWREFTPIVPNHMGSVARYPEFYLNNALHWFGYSIDKGKYILSFDMSDETFRVITMPAEFYKGCFLIMTSRGLVYAVETESFGACDPRFSVWVMREYGVAESWTKVFTVDMPHRFCHTMVKNNLRSLIFRGPKVAEVLVSYFPSDEELWDFECEVEEYEEYVQRLMSYDSESGESKCLLTNDGESICDLVLYKESLVLM